MQDQILVCIPDTDDTNPTTAADGSTLTGRRSKVTPSMVNMPSDFGFMLSITLIIH